MNYYAEPRPWFVFEHPTQDEQAVHLAKHLNELATRGWEYEREYEYNGFYYWIYKERDRQVDIFRQLEL
jgi:hypothetical protein